MKMKNKVCIKFERKVNNEVAAALQFSFDEMIINGLKSFRPVKGKEFFKEMILASGYSAIKVMDSMRFVYLCSLLEAFFKEYISSKSLVEIADIKPEVLNKYNKEWKEHSKKNKLGTNSLLNPNYANFIFEREYGFSFLYDLNKISTEIGALRNIIIHHDSRIPNDDFVCLLKNTLEYFNLPKQKGEVLEPTEKMTWIYIEDIRKIISICDEVIDSID